MVLRLSKKNIFFFLAIALTAFLLRFINLNSIPVFADEAIYVRWSQVMRAEESLRFLPLSDGKQPLFMWVTIPFLKVISDPLISGRIVSALSGLGSLVGVFTLSFLLFKSYRISLSSSLIFAILPFSVFFDRLALADSLLSFFGVWTMVFSILTVRLVRLDTAMIAGFFLGGALLTKSPGIYFALLIPFVLLMAEWPRKLLDKLKKLTVYIFLFAFTYGIGFALQNILRLGPNFHMISLRTADYVYPLTHIFNSPFDPLKPFLIRNIEYLWIMGTPLFVILLLLGIYFGVRNHRKETLLLLAWSIIPIFISSEYSKTMTARYIYPSIPFLVVLASIAFSNIKESVHKLTYVILALFVIAAIKINVELLYKPQSMNLPRSERSGYLEEWTSGYGIKEVSEFLKNEYINNPTKKIVVGTEGYFGTLPDGLQIYLNDIPEITVIGVGQPIRKVSDSLKESKKSGNKTYLVVNSTRLLEDPAKMGLNLITSYPKATKSDGSQESLLFFEVN